MTDISDVDVYTSPRLPRTFVKLYRDAKTNELIITLSDKERTQFFLPDAAIPLSEKIDTGKPDPIKTPDIPWKFDKEQDRWVKIKA